MVVSQSPRSHRAFTLIEVLIILVVIGILSGTMMLTMGSGSDKARATRIVSDMKILSRAAQMASADGVALGTDVTALSPYVSSNLDNEGRYALQAQDGYLYIKAALDDYGDGVRTRLAARADEWNLWQAVGEDSADTYADATAAFLPVNLMASASAEANFLLNILFSDFPDGEGLPGGLTLAVGGGDWTIVDGVLISNAEDPDNSERLDNVSFLLGEQDWENYTVTATVTFSMADGRTEGYGIYYLTTYEMDGEDADIDKGYRFQFDPGDDFVIMEVTGDYGETKVANVAMENFVPSGSTLDEYINSPHEIEITVNDGHHVISVDGAVVLELTDDTSMSGAVGIRDWGDGQTAFENISVTQN